ncbi:aspartate aminotransferase family protein [Lachnospiraceae bacterium MD308]|nr:aspartate aminotransferase family protein [Lachnospiraceae bacterium MD308]
MNANEYMQATERNLVHTYNRFPVTLDRGEGVYLYDTEGKKYLDFAAGIAVSGLGYGNQELNTVLKEQIDKLMHSSNLYYNTACGKAAAALKRITRMDRVFFTNSGTEAIEGALKAARKYAWKKKTGRFQYIAMQDSFHGRSMGALSVTEHEAYRIPFEPLIPGVGFAQFNHLDSVKKLVTDKTCAIILEPLQGEGGINMATQEFMEGIRKICDEEGILMICDEIQCGMARTGSMFACQSYGVKPDIIVMAKAIGSGVPVGAFAMTESVAEYSLEPGDHGTTYGGNPLVCAAVAKTVEIFEKEDIKDHVNEMGAYLAEKLDELVNDYDMVLERRGTGLIQGLRLNRPVGELIKEALKEGLLIISARSDVIRLVPPLVIEKEHVDEMIDKLKKALKGIL